MIKLNNITKIFTLPDKKLTALDNVSLHVPKGQICGVIGASGAGKSTLIRCVNLLERPTHGAVVIDDVDLTQLSDAELVKTRRQIGMIFQHFNLLTSRTVFENVALPLELENKSKAEIQEKTTALLALVGLSDKHNVYPANLSGGQKQRILLAKVLAQQTPILFLDEPTTGLDMVYQEEIFRFSKALAKMGKTILMVVHELNLAAKYCSRIILLGEGTVIADGRPDNVFTEKILSKAYNAPVRVIRSHNTNEIIEISTKEDNGRCQRDKELLELICCKGSIC